MILELSPCLTSSQACQKHRFSAGRGHKGNKDIGKSEAGISTPPVEHR